MADEALRNRVAHFHHFGHLDPLVTAVAVHAQPRRRDGKSEVAAVGVADRNRLDVRHASARLNRLFGHWIGATAAKHLAASARRAPRALAA
eukprot:3060440-Prymnesium_polylepis.1